MNILKQIVVRWALTEIRRLYHGQASYAKLSRYGIEDMSVANGELMIIVAAKSRLDRQDAQKASA